MNKKRFFKSAGFVASFLLFVAATSPMILNINNASAEIGTESETTLGISSENKNASVDLNVTDRSGNFATSTESQLAKFGVTTNNFTGYTLTISGTDNSRNLYNPSGAALTSIDNPTSEDDFQNAANTTYNNKWGFKPSKCISNCDSNSPTYESLSDNKYVPGPLMTGTVLDTTNAANNTANKYAIAVGARAGADAPEGAYTNTLMLTATPNPVTYSITYADNTGDSTVANLPAAETGIISRVDISLSETIPTRENYTFLRWCLGSAENNGTTCSGRSFSVGGDFGLDETIDSTFTLYAIWSPNITISVNTGSTKISLYRTECSSSCVVTGLQNGTGYSLSSTMAPFYNFASYAMDSGLVTSSGINTNYVPGAYPTTIKPIAEANPFTIGLNGNGATNNYTNSVVVTYYNTEINEIATLPERSYNVSGFNLTTAGTNATVSSTDTLTSNYTFTGWYSGSTTTDSNKVADNTNTPALLPNTSYTNANSEWNNTSGSVTLYAGWADGAVTLPTIARANSTCGWATNENATSYTYASGQTIYPTSDLTLYGVCTNNIILNANTGTLRSVATRATYNSTRLDSIVVPSKNGNILTRTISGFMKGNGADNATISNTRTLRSTSSNSYDFTGWYEEPETINKIASDSSSPVLLANTTYTDGDSKWNYTESDQITLYAGWIERPYSSYSEVDLPEIRLSGYTCGWSTDPSATTITYRSEQSIVPSDDIVLYGICTPNDYTIYFNANGGEPSSSAVITYGDTGLSTAIIDPTKEDTTDTRTVSGFTKLMGAENAVVSSTDTLTSSSTSSYTFSGWYSEFGTKVVTDAANTNFIPNSGYANSEGKWTRALDTTLYAGWDVNATPYTTVTLPTITLTGHTCGWTEDGGSTTSAYTSGATITPSKTLELYGVCTLDSYTISLDANGGNAGSTSTTATYSKTSLSEIIIPAKLDTIGIRKVSGFTAGVNASDAAIYDTAERSSTSTTNYIFSGWYEEPETINKIATSGTTPILLSNTIYADSSARWNYIDTETNPVTLYAGWERSATGYNSITLPVISKAGHTCGWAEANDATEIEYTSGQSLVPEKSMTLYGVCIPNSYHQTVQVRYQNASGAWGSYSTYSACTTDKFYGETHSCSIAATAEYQAAELAPYIIYGNETKQIDVYRYTKTVALAKGTGISSVTVTGSGVKVGLGTATAEVYYGGSITINASVTLGYKWVNWDGTASYTGQNQYIPSITTDSNFTANAAWDAVAFQVATAADCGRNMYDDRGSAAYRSIIYTTANINGVCWMTRNLDLPGGTVITPDDSNVTSSYTVKDGGGFGNSNTPSAMATRNTGNYNCDGYNPCFSYYSWNVAAAGKSTSFSGDTTTDICPKGWKLPSMDQLTNLKNAYPTLASIIASPFSGTGKAHMYYNGYLSNSAGGYWSTRVTGNYNWSAYLLRFNENIGGGGAQDPYMGTTYRGQGFSVRCVMK